MIYRNPSFTWHFRCFQVYAFKDVFPSFLLLKNRVIFWYYTCIHSSLRARHKDRDCTLSIKNLVMISRLIVNHSNCVLRFGAAFSNKYILEDGSFFYSESWEFKIVFFVINCYLCRCFIVQVTCKNNFVLYTISNKILKWQSWLKGVWSRFPQG